MDLYVLRHGIAVERGTAGYEKDSERPLTSEGKEKLRGIAKALRRLDLSFDVIFSSPYVRARETAELVSGVIAPGTRREFQDSLACDEDPRRFVAELSKFRPEPGSALVVGHEPHLSTLVSFLLSGTGQSCLRFKKGGCCKLRITDLHAGKCAELEWLLTPRQMLMMS